MKKLLSALSGRLPCRIISDGDRKYLERYYVATVFGVRFYLHRFVGSDPDRGLHDHPWPWAGSVVLSGWYLEEKRTGWRSVRWFNWLTGDTFHRIVLPVGPGEVWTLFFHRAVDCKPWGFINPLDEDINQAWHDGRYVGDCFSERFLFERFHASGKNKEWWKAAPKGRDCPERTPT